MNARRFRPAKVGRHITLQHFDSAFDLPNADP